MSMSEDQALRSCAARIFHLYRSTSCKHRLHERCRHSCKWCRMQCWCACHGRWGRTRSAVEGVAMAWERAAMGRRRLQALTFRGGR